MLQNDLDKHLTSSAMRTSLKTALEQLSGAEKLLKVVRKPDEYKIVNEIHNRPKNLVGGLPKDEAHQFFSSHGIRLLNMDKSRLSKEEKAILGERKRAMRTAGQLYTDLQRQALGLSEKQAPDKGQDRGPEM